MRDIKFRAWDKWHTRCEDDPSSMVEETHRVMIKLNGDVYNSEYGDDQNDRYIIMQYTGLKDNNGVEIYEGDIVSIMDCEPSLYKIIWVDDMFRFDVQYIGTDLTNWQDESMGEFSSEDFTVVGNIYENHELLK